MLTKGAIGNLINRYRAVLEKCRLMNVFGSLAVASMLVMGGAGVAQAGYTLLEDTTVLSDNINFADTAYGVANNVTAILDLNGYNVSAENSTYSWATLVNGNLIVKNSNTKNGTITGNTYGILVSGDNAVLNFDGGIVTGKDSYALFIQQGGNAIISGGEVVGYEDGMILITGEGKTASATIKDNAVIRTTASPYEKPGDPNPAAVFLQPANESSPVFLNVEGGLIESNGYAIVGNGNAHGTTINISGGEIVSHHGTAIYHPQDGVMNISGGKIIGKDTGIELRSGKLNISGGEITGLGNPFDSSANGNGTTTVGAALAISQHTTNKNIDVTITGGTFTGERAIYEEDLQDNNVDNISIKILNGTFNGEVYSENCRDFVTGGTFSHPTVLDYLGNNADITINLDKDYNRANDYRGDNDNRDRDGFTIENTQKVVMNLGEYTFKTPSLAVDKGGALLVNLPDGGGVAPESDKAFLALGRSLDLNDIGKLRVGTVSSSSAAAAFGADSTLVVDGKAASDQAMITGSGELSVADGAQLYIANAEANTDYIITEGLTSGEGEYWTEANLLANRLIKATISRDGDAVVVETEVKDVASALPGVIPVSGLTGMLAQNLNNTDSSSMGIRFLSRAVEPLYMGDDAKAVATINEVSRAAVTAGVQNTALRLADAGVDQLIHHLSLSFFGKENNIHKDGVDIWATPMYGNTYTHGMAASGAAVRGNYGGVTLGADAKVGEILGGKVRVGAAVNGGGGKSETRGTATSADNEYNFGGVNLYAGWNLDSLNVMASVGYAMANHDVKMNLPASMGMGQAKADVDTNAFIADLRAEYQINTGVADILPHAGVRYTALNTESHNLKVNGSTLNSVASDTQHIVQFPIGVTVSKDIDVSGWNVKPLADVSVIPAAGEKKNTTKVSYAGIGALDSVNTRIMDSTSWAGTLGVQAEKGNFALGLNYGVQASTHETDQSVSVGLTWKF